MRALGRAALAATFLFLGVALAAFGTNGAEPARGVKGDLQPVAAESPSPDLMRALMAWAEPHVGLPVPDALPRIVRKDHCSLWALVHSDAPCPDESPGGHAVQAVYETGVMWLSKDWRPDSLRDVSILLHELVHHMQHHAGVPKTPCVAEAWERPAYEAQFAFLESAGVDPYKAVGINALFLLFVTNCMQRR